MEHPTGSHRKRTDISVDFYEDLPTLTEVFTRLYRVLLGDSSGFIRVCRRSLGRYLILLGFSGYWLRFTGFYRILSDFIEFYWVLLGFTEFYYVLLGFYKVLPSFTEFYYILLGFY